jgi:hypothetical protein
MDKILVFILSCAGLTQILCYASILNWLRPKTGLMGELFGCSMCTGFHVGYLMFMFFWYAGVHLFPHFYIGAFIYSLISSFCSYVLDKTFSDEGIMINFKNKE